MKIALLFFLIIKTLHARTKEEQCEEGSESDFASHVLGRTFFSTWVSVFADSLPCVYDCVSRCASTKGNIFLTR